MDVEEPSGSLNAILTHSPTDRGGEDEGEGEGEGEEAEVRSTPLPPLPPPRPCNQPVLRLLPDDASLRAATDILLRRGVVVLDGLLGRDCAAAIRDDAQGLLQGGYMTVGA